jgi:hypothetical protein
VKLVLKESPILTPESLIAAKAALASVNTWRNLARDISKLHEGGWAMGKNDHTVRIRQRAHEIWEKEGRPHGRDLIHWLRAEAEIHEGLKAQGPTGKLPKATGKPPRKSMSSSRATATSRQQRPSKS